MIYSRNVYLGARLLWAFLRGEDSPDAMAGAMFLAAGLLCLIPDPRQSR